MLDQLEKNLCIESSVQIGVQALDAGYYKSEFDAAAFELGNLPQGCNESMMEAIADQHTAVLEVSIA